MDKKVINSLLLSDFNLDVLRAYFQNASSTFTIKVASIPFGQIIPVLIDENSEYWKQNPNFVIVWTQPEKVIPSFIKILDFKSVDPGRILKEVDDFCGLILNIQDKASLIFVPTWTIPDYVRGYGILEMKDSLGLRNILMKMNLRMAENFDQAKNIFVLDTNRWLQPIGASAFSPKLWYMSKIPFSQEVFKKASQDILSILENIHRGSKKVIILDLDETLWGGVIGEIGWQNIQIGGHDPAGEAIVDFQRALKSLRQRGILLTIVSKNEETIALEAFKNHPEMILKIGDFAGYRINWKDKAENIADLLQELNLGPQSAVFIDDNPVERSRVQEAFPEILVPNWPQDKMLYKKSLAELPCFDTLILSEEDKKRTEMYVQEKKRSELKDKLPSLQDWIKTLEIKVMVEELNEVSLPRAAQLFNKTNQMNLTTRRLMEKELFDWAKKDNRFFWIFRVSDKLGDSGLTGLVSLEADGATGKICDFVLSCRVIGRKVEESMLYICAVKAQELQLEKLSAEYVRTERNAPCLEFFKNSGFRFHQNCFVWELRKPYPCPEGIDIVFKHTSPESLLA